MPKQSLGGKGKKKKKGNQEPTSLAFWQTLGARHNAKSQMQLPGSANLFIDFTADEPIFKDEYENFTLPNNNGTIQSQKNKNVPKPGKLIHTGSVQSGKSGYKQPLDGSSKQAKPDKAGPPTSSMQICPNKSELSNPEELTKKLNKSVTNQGLEAKFKPIQEKEKLQVTTGSKKIPKPTNVAQSLLNNTDGQVIPVVGEQKKKINMFNQQKKILKFQMKIVSMQQEKARQMKAIQEINQKAVLHNQTKTALANPSGMQIPLEMQNLTSTPSCSNTPVNSNIAGNPIKTARKGPRTPKNINQTTTQMSPSPQPVETVFQVHQQPQPLTSSTNTKLANPNNLQKFSQSIKKWRPTFNPVDLYGFSYPKGVPRSFLVPKQQGTSQTGASDGPIWPGYQINPPMALQPPEMNASNPLMVDTDVQNDLPQPYSPSELYTDLAMPLSPDFEDPESQESNQPGQKRLSAFQRLGPQTQPKKPKLTISVTVNEDQGVSREVVDKTEEEEEITPVHFREDIILSNDETVIKYLNSWPWKKNVIVKKSVTVRNSKTVMMLEKEQMEEIYNKDTLFVQVTVTGYPSSWTKEKVLDTLMEQIRGYSFIPCFIEFNLQECKFLTLRCRSALLSLHKCGFIIRKNDVMLTITIAQTELTLNQLDFVPRLVLRKRLGMCSDKESKADLSAFTLKEDISHFIYFPLNRLNNQMEIIEMQNEISWYFLTELNLSHNRIESLDGFDLAQNSPKLRHLDLSYNCLEKITLLLKIRALPLKSIHLEGNPLCRNYTSPEQYVRTVKLMFSGLSIIDDVPVRIKGEMPKFCRNYCPEAAKELAEKFLQVYFPLLDGDIEHRILLEDMYENTANMTITYNYKLSFTPIFRSFKSLFEGARFFDQGIMDMVKGSKAIVKTVASWPQMQHDPLTFTVDVLFHNDSTAILRVDGILKLTRESLAEDEYLLAFSRTVVLHSRNLMEYKIQAETLHWSAPAGSYARSAFSIATIKAKQMYPKIESTTDEKLQMELLEIFIKLTTMDKEISERCLELKKWNLREALEHFIEMWKLDSGLNKLRENIRSKCEIMK